MRKIAIDMDELAKECGIKIVTCDPAFGGRWAYTEEPQPGRNQITIAGYRTRQAAIRGWFTDEFSSRAGQVLLKKYIKGVIGTKGSAQSTKEVQ